MMSGWDGGMSTGGWVLMIIFWVLLIVGIIWAIARLLPGRRESSSAPEADQPEAILDRRLAQGEIDIRTHDALREKLGSGAAKGGR